jgi:hypothetical protein
MAAAPRVNTGQLIELPADEKRVEAAHEQDERKEGR